MQRAEANFCLSQQACTRGVRATLGRRLLDFLCEFLPPDSLLQPCQRGLKFFIRVEVTEHLDRVSCDARTRFPAESAVGFVLVQNVELGLRAHELAGER